MSDHDKLTDEQVSVPLERAEATVERRHREAAVGCYCPVGVNTRVAQDWSETGQLHEDTLTLHVRIAQALADAEAYGRSELSTLREQLEAERHGVWRPMFDEHEQLNVREGEFYIFHAQPKDNDVEGYFCDSLTWDADDPNPQWGDGQHGWEIDDVTEFHPMPQRKAPALPAGKGEP